VRIVRSPEGTVVIDPSGRMPGRGAYLCREASCWDTAGRKRALEHALKVALPADVVAALTAGPAALTTIEHPIRVIGAPTGPPDAHLDADLNEGGAHGQE
jgi:predicted RNA-binding protein YlxR (DUF448 family)